MSYKDRYIMYFAPLKRPSASICLYHMFGDVNCVINYTYTDNLFFIFDIYEYSYISICIVLLSIFYSFSYHEHFLDRISYQLKVRKLYA